MSRALTSACVALLAVCVAGSAAFADKPKVAILGIEVVDNGAGIDKASTDFARDLTTALRNRPQAANGGPYSLAPNSKKELIDEKLLKSCSADTDYPCIASIGVDIDKDHGGTQFVIYGNLEKRTREGKKGFYVNLRILNVATKSQEQTWVQFIPQELTANVEKWAMLAYSKLTPGSGNQGGLVIKVENEGIDKGTVYIDGNAAGPLRSGTFKSNAVGEGKHHIVIEVGGFKRFEKDVTVVSGETHQEQINLERECAGPGCTPPPPCDPALDPACAREGTTSDRGNAGRGLKIGAGVTGALAVGSLAMFIAYEVKLGRTGPGFQTDAAGQLVIKDGHPVEDKFLGFLPTHGGHCQTQKYADGTVQYVPGGTDPDGKTWTLNLKACGHGGTWQTMAFVTGIGAAVLGGTAIYLGYKGWTAKNERPPAGGTVGRRTSKPPRNVVISPILSPDGGGATLRIDW